MLLHGSNFCFKILFDDLGRGCGAAGVTKIANNITYNYKKRRKELRWYCVCHHRKRQAVSSVCSGAVDRGVASSRQRYVAALRVSV